MRRRYGKALDSRQPMGENVNPMEGVANLADLMLVLAVGIMLALILNWNVDVGGAPDGSMTQMEDVTSGQSTDADSTDSYEFVGEVYRDPATGRLYMMEDDGK